MSKLYDLEERTFQYAKTISNVEHGKQVVRAYGFAEANGVKKNIFFYP